MLSVKAMAHVFKSKESSLRRSLLLVIFFSANFTAWCFRFWKLSQKSSRNVCTLATKLCLLNCVFFLCVGKFPGKRNCLLVWVSVCVLCLLIHMQSICEYICERYSWRNRKIKSTLKSWCCITVSCWIYTILYVFLFQLD